MGADDTRPGAEDRGSLASMNPTWKCPRCSGDDRYAIQQVLLADNSSANGVDNFTLTAHWGETGETGVFGAKMARSAVRAEAVVCAKCGYTELYAKDLAVLERFAAERQGGVRRLKG